MKRLFLLLSLPLSLTAACGGDGGDGGNGVDAGLAPECAIQSSSEGTPGAPYDLQVFRSNVVPILVMDCAFSGCHDPGTGASGIGGFSAYPDAATLGCNQVKTFNSFTSLANLATPTNSRILNAINGTNTGHTEKQYPAGDPKLTTLTNFIQAAADAASVTGPGTNSPADQAVFASTIQPAFTAAGCGAATCHGGAAPAAGYPFKPDATGADLTANFTAAAERLDLTTPNQSRLYVKATTAHGGGSTPLPSAAAADLLDWITAAQVANGGGNNTGTAAGCAPANNFNIGVFQEEILPMLRGLRDYNDLQGDDVDVGCVSNQGGCHDTNRGPGKFSLPVGATPEELLQNFACFVNADNPSQSAAVMCPLGPNGRAYCPVTTPGGHPGGEIFDGADDLNFQKLLSFVYSGKDVVQPFDFAFFAENINPVLNDVNASAETGEACASFNGCHGVSSFAQPAPGGSNFPIIAGASSEASLTFNFTSAAAFANFLKPEDSSLRLYPTNLIQEGSDFSLGIRHPGGVCFPPDSALDTLFLQFVSGLQPDAQGLILNTLAVGDFTATDVNDDTPLDARITANQEYQYKLFENPPPGAREFQGGIPQLLFSNDGNLDFNTVFPREETAGRIAYAQVCLFNSSNLRQDIRVIAELDGTNNAAELYINGVAVGFAQDGGTAPGVASAVPSYITGGDPVRVMVKVFQSADDQEFGFRLRVLDQNNRPFPAGDIIQTTSCAGGSGL